MNTEPVDPHAPPPPPPPAAVGAASTRLPNPYALFTVAAASALTMAVAIGGLLGTAAANAERNSCTPTDGWCGFGAAIAGLFVGVLVGLITYVAAGVIIIVKCRPKGSRATHIAAHLLAPPATILCLLILGSILP